MTTNVLSCAIIDDEPTARYGLKSYINRTPALNCEIEFSGAVSFAEYLVCHPAPDIVFMDILMPGMSGLEFIATHTTGSAIIIVSAYERYAIKGYDLNVTDYLLKPVSYNRFFKAVEKARLYLDFNRSAPQDNHIFIRADRQIVRIATNDIVYIEGLENYVRIFTTRDRIISRMTLKDILLNLPDVDFIRIHKSYIVNLSHIQSIRHGVALLHPPFGQIPVSRTYRDILQQAIDQKGGRQNFRNRLTD